MYYSEGYGTLMLWEDDFGNPVLRRVEDVRLLDQFDVDTTVRPVVDSSPGHLHRRAWKFDSYWGYERLDRFASVVLD